jgi:hypothetical protein
VAYITSSGILYIYIYMDVYVYIYIHTYCVYAYICMRSLLFVKWLILAFQVGHSKKNMYIHMYKKYNIYQFRHIKFFSISWLLLQLERVHEWFHENIYFLIICMIMQIYTYIYLCVYGHIFICVTLYFMYFIHTYLYAYV